MSIFYTDSNGNVGFLNPATGANNVIGNPGRVFLDVAQNASGQLFGVASENSIAKLYSINPQNGVATFLSDIGSMSINALAADAGNNLYAVNGSGQLLRISASGAVTTVGTIGSSEGDLLVIGNNVYMSRADNVLVKYDLGTNQVSNVANVPDGIFGLAQNPNGNIYAVGGDGKVYDVNPSNGSVVFTGSDVNIPGNILGTANSPVVTSVPPATPGSVVYVDSNGNIGTLNPATGANNVIANTGKVFFDVAQNASGQLFGVTLENNVAKLYSIAQNGGANFVADIGVSTINSLAADAGNNLYAVVNGSGQLLRISTSGAVTTLGNIGQPRGDILVIGNNVYMSRADNVLVKYDLTNNQVSNVANLPDRIFGLAQNQNGNIYAVDGDGKVYDVNPSNGSVVFTGSDVNIPGTINGTAGIPVVTSVPPATPGSVVYVDSNGNIGTLNPATGANNVIANTGKVFFDVAQNASGQLFGVTLENNVAKLYSIAQNGGANFVADIGVSTINSLAADAGNNLYAVVNGSGQLLRISTSGAVTTLGDIGQPRGDILVIGNNVYMSRADNVLVKYDLTNNQVSNVANLPDRIFGLAQNQNGNIYAVDGDGKVYDVNPSNGSVVFTGSDVNIPGTINGTAGIPVAAPTTPTVVADVVASSDTGVSNTDNITTDNTPSFVVANPTDLPVTLYVNGTPVASTYDPATNIVTPTNAIPNGSPVITYALGTAPNLSAQSPALTVTIDTQAPAAPTSRADMTAASDTGVSNTDNNTDDSTPDFAVTAPVGTTPSLYVDGVKVPSTFANGVLTPTNPIANGTRSVTYTLTDAAGNESAPSSALSIVIGTQVNPVPGALTLAPASDTGVVGDNITTDRSPKFIVDNPNDVPVKLFANGVEIGGTTYDPLTNTVSLPSSLQAPNGTYQITYALVNNGVTGPQSAPLTLQVQSANGNFEPDARDDVIGNVNSNNGVILFSPASLLANDFDSNGDAVRGVAIGEAQNGQVTFDGSNVVFTVTPGYTGLASFTYTITDDKGGFDNATVSFNVTAVNDNVINGTAGNDTALNGTNGNDVINGLAGNDTIQGGNGNDIISGGRGNDTMAGNGGSDIYKWVADDIEPLGNGEEVDTVFADAGDKLDLRDLLINESATSAALDNYLHFNFVGGDTQIKVSVAGSFNDGNISGVNATVSSSSDQTIVLKGFDLTAGNTLTDQQIIQNLLNAGALITD